LDDLILKIPHSERRKLLLENVITDAVAVNNNWQISYLMIVWKEYFEPTLEATCNPCLGRVLKNFKAMHPRMLEMEQEANLLG